MLRNQLQFQSNLHQDIKSIQYPKGNKHNYESCINNPLKQQFSNVKLASTMSIGRSVFQKQLETIKQKYIIRTEYIRINDTEIMEQLFQLNLDNLKRKYQKYSKIEQLNIHPKMIQIFQRFGYKEMNTFMQLAIVHLLFEFKSLLQYEDKWQKDAIIALTSIAFLKYDCLFPQIIIVCPDDENGIIIKVMLEHLNINYNNIYQVSNKNSIVDDRKYLKQAQIILGTPDRLYYVIKQKYLNPIFLESIIFQEFSLTSDLGFCNQMEYLLQMIPTKTSRHFFFSQVFNIKEHNILDI